MGTLPSWWLTVCSPLAGALLAVLVVGLGGGSLPLFIHDYFSQARVAVVEIDPSMLEVATCWFGFSQGDRMRVHVSDGLDYVAKLAAEGTILRNIPHTPSSLLSDTLGTGAIFTLCFPIIAYLLPCVMSSSLARSLQFTGLSLPRYAGDLDLLPPPVLRAAAFGFIWKLPREKSCHNMAEGVS